MDRIYTEEDKRRQAEKIRAWKPWDHTLHPRTPETLAITAQNSLKHGLRSAAFKALSRALKDQREFLSGVETE